MRDRLMSRSLIHGGVAVVLTMALSAGTAHANPQEDNDGWNCQTMGNHVCGHVVGSWIEHNPGVLAELMFGYVDTATPGSTDFAYGDVPPVTL